MITFESQNFPFIAEQNKILTDNLYKITYEAFRTECSSCRKLRLRTHKISCASLKKNSAEIFYQKMLGTNRRQRMCTWCSVAARWRETPGSAAWSRASRSARDSRPRPRRAVPLLVAVLLPGAAAAEAYGEQRDCSSSALQHMHYLQNNVI